MDTTRTAAARHPRRGAALVALALATSTVVGGLPGTAASARPAWQTAVVTGAGDVAGAVRSVGGQVLDRLPLIGGVSARLPLGTDLGSRFTVVPDRPFTVASTDASAGPASTVRATLGLGAPQGEGAGVTVAVVDTGVADVADLQGRVSHVDVGDGTGDGYGHGTFVAGLIAGDGQSSDGAYAGVAPAAHILDVRVARDDGSSSLVEVLAGLQAVATHPEVRVLNLSLSSGSPLPYEIDPLTVALEALWAKGITVVVPAGNDGAHGAAKISSPGVDPVLLTVGGLDENGTAARSDDTVADWSSQGPAPQGVQKPDLVAPGAHVISTAAVGSTVWDANPTARVGDAYFKGSGTSFSTAVTSGAAAVLLQDRPALSPDQVKALVTGTAYAVPGTWRATGAGGLDLAAALAAATPDASSTTDVVPGDPSTWNAVLQALLDGDLGAAASSWAQLSPEARQWAARQWAALDPEARQWAARQWAGGEDWAARQWAARQWAARQWAARQWAARQWAGDDWAARQWAARQWAARQWAGDDWAARQWTARQWSSRQWAADDWR